MIIIYLHQHFNTERIYIKSKFYAFNSVNIFQACFCIRISHALYQCEPYPTCRFFSSNIDVTGFDLTFTRRFEEENLNGGYVSLNVSFVSFLQPVFVLPSFHLLKWFYFYLIFYSHEFASISINSREEDQIICPDLIG